MTHSLHVTAGLVLAAAAFTGGCAADTAKVASGGGGSVVLRPLAGPTLDCRVSGCDAANPVAVTLMPVAAASGVPAHCVVSLPGNILVTGKVDRNVVWQLKMSDGGAVIDYEFEENFGLLVIDGDDHLKKGGRGNGTHGSKDVWLYYAKHIKGKDGDVATYLPVVQQRSGDRVMCAAIDPKITSDN